MKKFLPSSALRRRILGILVAQVGVLGLIGLVVSFQVRRANQRINEMADLKDPSPFTATLVGELNQTNLNLLSYGQTHDVQALLGIRQSEQKFEESLGEFQNTNPRLFPATAHARILSAYDPFKTAVQDVLTAQDNQSALWDKLLSNDDQILFLFEHRMRPIVRMNQAMATARLDLILNLENAVRLVPKDLAQFMVKHSGEAKGDLELNGKKFDSLMRIYKRINPLPNERQELHRIGDLWAENLALDQTLLTTENTKSDALARMIQSNQTLQSTIAAVLPAVRPDVIEEKKVAILHQVTLILVFSGIMVLAGIGSAILSGLWIYRKVRRSFDNIKEVAEAAVTGDLSREVDVGEKDLGNMGESVNRLIGVMRRSEKMIYQLGSIVESSGDASIGMTLDGTILSWNQNAQRMYGYSSTDIKGKSIEMLFAPEEVAMAGMIAERIQKEKKVMLETVHLRKSGVKIPVRLIVTRIVDSTDTTIGISMLSRELVPLNNPVTPKKVTDVKPVVPVDPV